MKYNLVCAAAVIALSSVPAAAQDFSGPRVEVNLGWDHVGAKADYADSAYPGDDFSVKGHSDGLLYGASIGYDLPVGGRFTVGPEVSLDLSTVKECSEVFGGDSACLKARRNIAVGGRVGARVGEASLFYVGGAYVNGRAGLVYRDLAAPGNDFDYSANRGGYRVSAGVEQRLSGMWYAKLEYRYNDYKDYTARFDTAAARLGLDRHQVVGGFGARF